MRTRTVGSVVFLFGLGVVASCAAPSSESGRAQSIFDPLDPASHDLAEELAFEELDARDTTLLYGVDAVETRSVFLDELGQAHTRLVQTLDGIPVFGAEGVVHLNADGGFGQFTDGLLHDVRVDTAPVLGAFAAVELAVAATGGWAPVTGQPEADLQILRRDGVDHLAWRVQIGQFEEGFDPAMPVVFVDAHGGLVVWQYDNLQHVALTDDDKTTWDLHNSTSYLAATIADSNDPIANETHVHAGWTLAYFLAAHGRDSFNGAGAHVDSYVHYSVGYVNAFWNGSSLTFGDGDNVTSGPLTTLDIVAHEFSHGVTEYSSDLIYADESGALNEATSDIFAAAVEADQGGNFEDIWWVGEDTWLQSPQQGVPPALRYMNDPAIAGDYDFYPTRYTGGSDNGGVHWNSGIANLAFHLLSVGGTHPRGKTTTVVTGIGIQNAAAIWYRALTVYMVPSTNFSGARGATIAAANDLNPAWVPSVEQAWDAVGVAPPPDYTVIDQQTNLSGATGNIRQFGPYSTAGCTAIKFEISGGTGDADLYVRFGGQPSLSNWDCRPYTASNNESCEFNPSQSGSYYAMVHGYASYGGLTFKVSADCGTTEPLPPSTWTQLHNATFESGWSPYADGGSDARRLTTSFAHQGTHAVELRDNSGGSSSTYLAQPVDLSGRSELKVSFWYQARSFEAGEDFYVELSNGSTWQVIGRFVRGTDFENNTFNNPVITVSSSQVVFGSSARVRFRADASNDDDDLYIDDVTVSVR